MSLKPLAILCILSFSSWAREGKVIFCAHYFLKYFIKKLVGYDFTLNLQKYLVIIMELGPQYWFKQNVVAEADPPSIQTTVHLKLFQGLIQILRPLTCKKQMFVS